MNRFSAGEVEIIQTADGSSSLRSEKFGDTYHSINGAVQESQHVFIEHGLEYLETKQKHISILEYGFGTGLNCLLTWKRIMESQEMSSAVLTLEAFPLSLEVVKVLGYHHVFNLPAFLDLHRLPWDRSHRMDDQFTFEKRRIRFEVFQSDQKYDLIYFDAFSPSSQPELWRKDFVYQVTEQIKEGGILVTYCAQGSFKRSLREFGLTVETLPGPPGKREMTRAHKP